MNDEKRRALNTFCAEKTNTSLRCTSKIPGIFEQLSDHKIATGPQRQPHRIARIEQPLAQFSPGGMFLLVKCLSYRLTDAPTDHVTDSQTFHVEYTLFNVKSLMGHSIYYIPRI